MENLGEIDPKQIWFITFIDDIYCPFMLLYIIKVLILTACSTGANPPCRRHWANARFVIINDNDNSNDAK